MVFYIKENDRVYFVQMLRTDIESESIDEKDFLLPSNISLWNTGKDNETVVATYTNRMSSFIRYSDCFNVDDLCPKTIICDVVPKIKEIMRKIGMLKDNCMTNGFFVCKGDKVYRINTKGVSYDEGECYSLGDYSYECLFALRCTSKMPVKERIKKVIKCVANAGSVLAYPIAVTDSINRKLQMFESEDEFDTGFDTTCGEQ